MRPARALAAACLAAAAVGLTARAEPPAAAPAAPQAPTAKAPVFAVGLDEVHVTVSVRDAQGRLVSDLSPDEFEVLEDGRPQRIQLFGRAVDADLDGNPDAAGRRQKLAVDLGLLLDTSTSMLKELKVSQQAATHFLESIPRARELYTIFFADDILLSRYDSENQQGLYQRIHEAKGGGNTVLYDAIAVYLSRVHDAPGRKVMVVFTDGDDSRSELSFTELLRIVRSSGVVIYPIAFSGGLRHGSAGALRARSVLDELATLTGGRVFQPRSFRDLDGIYRQILDELAAQYVIGYVSDNPGRDGRFRRLKVQVKRRGLVVRHRSGYTPFTEAVGP